MATRQSVKIQNGYLAVGGRQQLLLSGEFHYWRHSPSRWPEIFDRIREIGIELVSTFVPFNFHETARGKFDFAGRTLPERNLAGFLNLAKRKKFHVILRPSPNEAGEWPNGGLPGRLLKFHRLHPRYIAGVKQYYDAALRVVAPNQATRGGPIVMVQADNEPYPDLRGRYDQIVGPGGQQLFAHWLRMHYGEITALNRKWHSAYKSFDEPQVFYEESIADREIPALRRLLPNHDLEPRFTDTQKFVMWYSAEIVRWTADYFRQRGIEVPLVANSWHPSALDYIALRKNVECLGVDIYPARNFKGNRFYAYGKEDVFKVVLESLKLAKAQVGWAYCPEFSAGIPQFWLKSLGVVAENHPIYVGLTCLAYGLAGISYYMLVNRDNWCLAPIDELGHPTDLYAAYREVISLARRIEPPAMRNLCDISLLSDLAHRSCDAGNYDDVFNTFLEADLDFELFDPDAAELPGTSCLVYSGSERLSRRHQEQLVKFVELGGKLIFFSRFPAFDETGAPCNLLEIPLPDAVRPVSTPLNISCRGHVACVSKRGHCGHGIHLFHYRPGTIAGSDPINTVQLRHYLAIPGGDGVYHTEADMKVDAKNALAIGFVKRRGKGQFAVIGMNPSAAMVNLMMQVLNVPYYCRCHEPQILTTIHRKKGGRLILFLRNGGADMSSATVHLELERLGIKKNGSYRLTDLRDNTTARRRGSELGAITTRVNGYDVRVFEIAPRACNE